MLGECVTQLNLRANSTISLLLPDFVVVTRYSTPTVCVTSVAEVRGSSRPHCQVLPPVDSAMVSAALCAERAETAKKKATDTAERNTMLAGSAHTYLGAYLPVPP